MQSTSLVPVKQVRQTIDSRDKFAQRLCSLLGWCWHQCILFLRQTSTCFLPSAGIQPTSAAPLLTHASLMGAVEQLAHQITTMEALLAAHLSEQQQITAEQWVQLKPNLEEAGNETIWLTPQVTAWLVLYFFFHREVLTREFEKEVFRGKGGSDKPQLSLKVCNHSGLKKCHICKIHCEIIFIGVWRGMLKTKKSCGNAGTEYQVSTQRLW